MAKTSEDLEAYLTRLDRRYEKIDPATYVVSFGPNQPPAALRLAPPVLVVQVDVGPAPREASASATRLFRKLLELNATDLLHVAYGIENDRIVLASALEFENLDLNEIEAVLSNIDLAMAEHIPVLRDIAKH